MINLSAVKKQTHDLDQLNCECKAHDGLIE